MKLKACVYMAFTPTLNIISASCNCNINSICVQSSESAVVWTGCSRLRYIRVDSCHGWSGINPLAAFTQNLASVYTKWGQSSVTCPQRAHPCSSITQSQIHESYVMIIGLSSYCREALGDRDALSWSLLVISALEVMVELFKVFIPVKPGIHTVTV